MFIHLIYSLNLLEEALLLSGGCQYAVITAGLFLPLQPQHVGDYYTFALFYFTSLVSGGLWDVANGLITLRNNLLKYMMERSSKCMGLVCNPKDGYKETSA